jgi:hypothetical protein
MRAVVVQGREVHGSFWVESWHRFNQWTRQAPRFPFQDPRTRVDAKSLRRHMQAAAFRHFRLWLAKDHF